ncbi:MAG: hypothetical protein EB127_08670 [Alphaproteobacteria bacterium]|nr:hypothetical protein [Alphaproteobacteria bacterium]
MKKSKFIPLYETIYNRFKQGGGFLEGDVVKLKDNYKSAECYKNLPESIKQRLEDSAKSGYNLRVGRLHTPDAQYGALGNISLPATHADLYQERAPGSFGNLVTVPIDILEVIDTGVNLPPVSANNKMTPNEAPYIKPTKKGKGNKNPMTDEQTDTSEKQTHAKNGDYDLATKNGKNLPGANKYDDLKPSSFKPLPKNKKRLSESMNDIENVYLRILTEDNDTVSGMGGDNFAEEDVAVAPGDMTEGKDKLLFGKRKVEQHMVRPECWDHQAGAAISECWNEDGSLRDECWDPEWNQDLERIPSRAEPRQSNS